MTFLVGLVIGGSCAVLVLALFATKAWSRGVAHGRAEAARELEVACRMLTKRVEDLELLRVAREPVPEVFLIKAQTEVLEWAESLAKELKKQQGLPQSQPSPPPPSSSELPRIQPL